MVSHPSLLLIPVREIKFSTFDFICLCCLESSYAYRHKQDVANEKPVDLYEQLTKNEYYSLFEQLEFAYGRTINLGNEFWRFLEIDGDHHLCLYHQLNKQFIMYKPDVSLLSFPWPYDGIVDVSWSKAHNVWTVATQTQIVSSIRFIMDF